MSIEKAEFVPSMSNCYYKITTPTDAGSAGRVSLSLYYNNM